MLELMLVVVIVGILAAMIGPRIGPILQRTGAANTVAVVALDLEHAVSLAARQRGPVRITCDCPHLTYTITDRGSGAVLFRRLLAGVDGGASITSLALSASSVDVFPSGLTSSPLTITVGAGPVTRRVTMSTGGFVRVIR